MFSSYGKIFVTKAVYECDYDYLCGAFERAFEKRWYEVHWKLVIAQYNAMSDMMWLEM